MERNAWERLQHDQNNGWEGMHSPEPWNVIDPDALIGEEWLGGGMWITAALGSAATAPIPPPDESHWSLAENVCDILPHGEEAAADRKRANAARIVACINFCRGFSTEALTGTTLREVLDTAPRE